MNDLKRKTLTGAGWIMGSAVVVRVLQIFVTVALARLLMPGDFGLFAMAFMVVNAVNIFRDYGLAQSLIYRKDDIEKSADTTFWMSAGFGVAAWLVVYLLSPVVSLVFRKPALIIPLQVMSLSVIITSLSMVPSALLEKELMFRRRALPEIANGVVYAAVSVALAFAGFGVWSLVWGHIAGAVALCAATWIVTGWRPGPSFHAGAARDSFSYGRSLMMGSVLIFAFFYLDHAAVGRFLGASALGFYNLAFTICNLPATNITHVVNKVMFPTYTKLNEDSGAMRYAYLQTVRSVSVLSFPIALGLCVFPMDFVPVFFGEKWLPTIPLFRVLAIYGLYRSIGAMCGSVFMALGQPYWILRTNSIQVLVAVSLVYSAAQAYGTVGVAGLFTSAYILGTTVALWKVKTLLKLKLSDYGNAVKGAFIASVAAIGAAYLFAHVCFDWKPVRVACEVVATGVFYVGLILWLDQDTAGTARSMLDILSRKRRGAAAA